MTTLIDPKPVRQNVVVARRSSTEVRSILANLPAILSGQQYDKYHLRQVFLAHFTRQLLHSVHVAFMTKSAGGTDDLGYSWEPLELSTIRAKQRKFKKLTPHHVHTATRGQKTAWSREYNKMLPRFRALGFSEEEARAEASSRAWDRLRRGTAGMVKVPIGINTGQLEKSLRPGHVSGATYHAPTPDQECNIRLQGKSTFGSNVPHAGHFHRKRPLFPSGKDMAPWFTAAVEAGRNGVLEHLKRSL